jgi:ADP-heptose:LPS heptosyltransferase
VDHLRTINPTKVLILRALYLGDFICATPALTAIRTRFSRAELTLVGLPWTAGILGRFNVVDRFEFFPGFPGLPEVPHDAAATDQFLERMRANRFDLAVQLHGDGHVSNGFISAIQARESIGYKRASDADQRICCSLDWREDESEVHRWLRLVEIVGANASDRVRFPVTPVEREAAAGLLGQSPTRGPRIGLHCGSKLASRRWPLDRFAQLGNQLARAVGASLVLTGSTPERPLTAQLRSQLHGSVLDLTGETDLGTLAAVVGSLDLLVTNDTGVSHIAAARRTPSVVLFGPSDPRRWAPLDSQRHRVVDGGGDRRQETSIANIHVDRVFSECLELLSWSRNEYVPPPGAGIAVLPDWSRRCDG